MIFLLQHDDFSLFLIYNMTIFDIVGHCLKIAPKIQYMHLWIEDCSA